MCKLPKGKSDFRELIINGYVYVDKTNYIEKLENGNDSYVHFLRPRRFGKSLFTSMLGCYYDLAVKDEFDILFKNTYIHEHPTKEKNSYYILNFDFSGLNTDDSKLLSEALHNRIYRKCQDFLIKYKSNILLERGVDAADTVFQFLSQMKNELSKPIYVIIDEYDHFANELLSFDFDNFQNMVSKNGYVRKFYEVLKMGTGDGTIGRIFVTGVSPITLDSLTSGYNISSNLSLDARYNEMMGFTSEEVKQLISMVDNVENEKKTLADMKQYYDGYRFSEGAQHHVFNPNMALYYLDGYQTTGKEPKEIIDRNIFSDYSKLENLLYIKKEDHTKNVQRILEGEHPGVVITQQYTLSERFNDQDFFSLLFYLGYLTIDEADDFILTMKIPNMVMKKVFIRYFQHMLEKQLEFQVDINSWQMAIASFITKNDSDKFIDQIETILHKYPDRMFENFKERNVQQIGEMIVGAINGVDSDLEYGNDEGYCDQIIIPTSDKYHRKLIEYKYLKRSYTDKELEKAITDARSQIERYSSTRQMKRYPYDAWIMVFSKDSCIYKESVDIKS